MQIQFISTVDGLDKVEELLPKQNYIPNWFKKIPRLFEGQKSFEPGGTVRRCPSYADWFKSGVIVPNWCEVILANDGINWRWTTSSDMFMWEQHDNMQYIDHLPSNVKINAVYKAINPWKIVTPKGWSVMQLPVYYDYNQNWETLPGIIDTDKHHEVNPQIALTGNDEIINIPAGVPLFKLIPFKREKLNLKILSYNDISKKLKNKLEERHLRLMTSFTGNYRKLNK